MKEKLRSLEIYQDAADEIVMNYISGKNILLELQNHLYAIGENLASFDSIFISPDVRVSIIGEIALQTLISDFIKMKSLAIVNNKYRIDL